MDDVRKEVSGDYKKLILAVLKCERDETTDVNMRLAMEDAKTLYSAGVAVIGTDEDAIIQVFAHRNYAQMRAIEFQYNKMDELDLSKALYRETSHNFGKALDTILQFSLDSHAYFADRFHSGYQKKKAKLLTYLMVTRCEVDLKDIESSYRKKYHHALKQHLHKATRGDHRKLLEELFHCRGTLFSPHLVFPC